MTFTSMHVYAGSEQGEDVRRRLADRLRDRILAEGFLETEPDDEADNRLILIGPAAESGWIAVDGSLGWDIEDPAAVTYAQDLSAALAATVVLARASDSDLLELWLYREGGLVDRYASNPEFLNPPLPRRRWKEVAGDARRWADVLLPAASPAMLQDVWRKHSIFAEDTFYAIAPLLGIDPGVYGCLEPGDGVLQLAFRPSSFPAPGG